MASILASEYNNLRSRLVSIMVGEYDQLINATTNVVGDYVTNTTSTDIIKADQWNRLYIDMIRARVHQDATFVQQPLWIPSVDKVAQVDLTYLQNLMTDIETNNRVLDVVNQASINVVNTETFSNWNGTQTASINVQFFNALERQYYFNTGSQIRISISNDYVGTASKTNEWKSMFSQMGNIVFDYTQTYSQNNSGTGSLTGNDDLTTTDETVYLKTASTYSGNEVRILASRNPTGNEVDIFVRLSDFDNPPGDGIDENVLGNTVVTFELVRADGTVLIDGTNYSTVIAPVPTVNGIVIGQPTPTYSLSGPSEIDEGSTASYTVSTTNVPTGTTLYWFVDSTTLDFDSISGQFIVDSSGNGAFDVVAKADQRTDGNRIVDVYLRIDSAISGQIVDSQTLLVNDTSQEPIFWSVIPDLDFTSPVGVSPSSQRIFFNTTAPIELINRTITQLSGNGRILQTTGGIGVPSPDNPIIINGTGEQFVDYTLWNNNNEPVVIDVTYETNTPDAATTSETVRLTWTPS